MGRPGPSRIQKSKVKRLGDGRRTPETRLVETTGVSIRVPLGVLPPPLPRVMTGTKGGGSPTRPRRCFPRVLVVPPHGRRPRPGREPRRVPVVVGPLPYCLRTPYVSYGTWTRTPSPRHRPWWGTTEGDLQVGQLTGLPQPVT